MRALGSLKLRKGRRNNGSKFLGVSAEFQQPTILGISAQPGPSGENQGTLLRARKESPALQIITVEWKCLGEAHRWETLRVDVAIAFLLI